MFVAARDAVTIKGNWRAGYPGKVTRYSGE